MKRYADRGKWGTFLVDQREARNWTQEEAFGKLRGGLGLGPKSRSAYVMLERGTREPAPAEQRFLVDFYRAEPVEPPAPTEGNAAMVAALNRQAAAMEALTARLEQLLIGPADGWTAVLADSIGAAMAQTLASRATGSGGSAAPADPVGSIRQGRG